MTNYWDSNTNSTPITIDMIKAVMDKINNDRDLQICTHVVGPHDKGWSICANCFSPVFVPERP